MAGGSRDEAFIKDPDAVLDYGVGFTTWLAEAGDTLASAVWTVLTGTVQIDSDVSDTTTAIVWLRGGTAGETCKLRVRVTTNNTPQRTDDRTIYVRIREK